MDDDAIEQLKAAESVKQSLKLRKEDFVSNLTGGDIFEINYVTLIAPVSLPSLKIRPHPLPKLRI